MNSQMKASNSVRKPQINVKIIALIIVGVLAVGGGVTYFAVSNKGSKDPIVGKISGEPVTLKEANSRLQAVQRGTKTNFSDLPPESKAAVLREEAAHRLLIEDAKKQKVISKSDLKKEQEVFEENLLQKLMLERIANDAVNEEKIKAAYEKEVAKIRGQQEVHARHILVKTQEDARKVKEDLDTKSFKDVAKDRSIDQKTAKDGGDLGLLYTGNMLKEFDEAISKLKPGETSDPVKSEFGWHIIKLDGRAPAKILPYEQAKEKVAIDLSKQAIKKYVDEMLKGIKIETM